LISVIHIGWICNISALWVGRHTIAFNRDISLIVIIGVGNTHTAFLIRFTVSVKDRMIKTTISGLLVSRCRVQASGLMSMSAKSCAPVLLEVRVPVRVHVPTTGHVRTRSLTLIAAAGCAGVVDACLTRIAAVIIAYRSVHRATALDGTLLARTATAITANYPIRRAAAVAGTSTGIFTTNPAAIPIFRTAFARLNANLFIPTADVAANFFFPAAEAAQAHPISSTVVEVIALNVAIPCLLLPVFHHTPLRIPLE
jgi:hypothetical protein